MFFFTNHILSQYSKFAFLVVCFASLAVSAYCQPQNKYSNSVNSVNNEKINIFLDCRGCSSSYIRSEVTLVNFMRDKEDADVHMLITRQRTASGGNEYTLHFLGRNKFKGKSDTLKYLSFESDTKDERRSGLVKFIKIGLVPYLYTSGIINDLDLTYKPSTINELPSVYDPWNNWIFEVDFNSFFNGEESRKNLYLRGGLEAQHISPEWKIRLDYNQNFNRQSFTDDEDSTTIYVTESKWFNGYTVKSINEHWSWGLFTNVSSSSRNNMNISYSGSPAIEYNIFPYSEYARREISFSYHISAGYYDYTEKTIFGKHEEVLLRHQFRSRIEFTQPWGEVESRINAYAYIHDLTKNRMDINMELDVRIFRGLSVSLSGRYSWINDQLSVPAGETDDAELLLNLKQQATSYSFGGSVGIEYSFGSIFNNTVNPRF